MSFTHFDITTKNALITLRSERANILASADSSKMAMWLTHSEAEELRDRLTAALEISRQQIDAARAPSGPIDKTDKQKIRQAFLALRKAGWFARMNFKDCGSCASAAVPKEYADRCVYYHIQNGDAFGIDDELKRPLYLSWDNSRHPIGANIDELGGSSYGSADEIVEALRAAGLNAEWNGDPSSCVVVKDSALVEASARA